MIEYHVFPKGKKRIVTFSYDDGHIEDERLVKLLNKYRVKATFHLNGENASEETKKMLRERYKGHEISCHTVNHGWQTGMPYQSVILETMENRKFLEGVAEYPVVGMSYPSGIYNEEVKTALKMCGIVYSRTIRDTMNFEFPYDFLEWHPTCHHKDALRLSEIFLSRVELRRKEPLFYIWGHSHEFKTEKDWIEMEMLLKRLSCNDKIWYASNIEIYQYMMAQRSLIISADENIFYNPSVIDVWVEKDRTEVICVPAGKCVSVNKMNTEEAVSYENKSF